MATLTFLSKESGSIALLNGVYGQRTNDGKLEVDPALRRIYLFSLNPIIEARPEQMVDVSVDDDVLPALKATLLHHASQRWARVYEANASLAGPLAMTLRAEGEMVKRHCDEIIREAGFEQPQSVAVDIKADMSLEVDSSIGETVTLDASSLINEAQSVQFADETENFNMEAMPPTIDLDDAGDYTFQIRSRLNLFGTDEQIAQIVERALQPMLQAGVAAPVSNGDAPAAVFCSYRLNQQDQQEQNDQPEAPRG